MTNTEYIGLVVNIHVCMSSMLESLIINISGFDPNPYVIPTNRMLDINKNNYSYKLSFHLETIGR